MEADPNRIKSHSRIARLKDFGKEVFELFGRYSFDPIGITYKPAKPMSVEEALRHDGEQLRRDWTKLQEDGQRASARLQKDRLEGDK